MNLDVTSNFHAYDYLNASLFLVKSNDKVKIKWQIQTLYKNETFPKLISNPYSNK